MVFDFLYHLYDGLPVWVVPVFWVALVLILGSMVSLVVLAARAQREYKKERKAQEDEDDPAARESEFLWVYMVPALNEEITIADSVQRLAEVNVTHSRILVINDGSEDETGQVLAGLAPTIPALTVLTRVAPNARLGKSEALNDAWRYLHSQVLGAGEYRGWDPKNVIVVIVDADGRLDREAGKMARHFVDSKVGGVQSQVRIYNREGLLTRAQDLEFGVFGSVFQLGRTGWGIANMGGNGQFNRLAALDQIAVPDAHGALGPWRPGRLTEDQDIGLRMIHQGWRGEQSTDVTIDQQGLHSFRLLFRQRTRWAQGGWQVLDLMIASLRNRNIGVAAKWDQLWYLLTPLIQSWVGISLGLSVGMLAVGLYEPAWTIFMLALLYVFSALPGIIGILFARRRPGIGAFLLNILIAHLYLVYSWMIYPVVYRALVRHLVGSKSWAKTKREQIEPPKHAAA